MAGYKFKKAKPLQLFIGEKELPVPCQLNVVQSGKRIATLHLGVRDGVMIVNQVTNPILIAGGRK